MNEHSSILQELIDSGLTQSQIAQSLGKSQAWVSAVLRGEFGDIKWADGVKLRELRINSVSRNAKEAA